MSASSEAEVDTNKPDEAQASRPRFMRILIEWGVPIVLGAALGALILWAPRLFKSDAQRIVDRWEYENYEREAELEGELVALGESARKDLREAYLAFDDPMVPELLIWLGGVIGHEPFYDTRFLDEQARSGATWQRRCAAVSLVQILDKKADPEIVLPGIIDWLKDDSAVVHEPAISAAGYLLGRDLVPADRRETLKKLLIHLADRAARGHPGKAGGRGVDPETGEDGGDTHVPDRSRAVEALGAFLPADSDVYDLMERVARDEIEFGEVRVMAIRMLSENGAFDHADFWREIGGSADEMVRQCVAENLFRNSDPGLNDLLLTMHSDANPLVRNGSISTQRRRRMATPLKVFHVLLEDSDQWVRFQAIRSAATFKDHDGGGGRAGHILEILKNSDETTDVEACVLTLYEITKEAYGFKETEIGLQSEVVEPAPLEAFVKDKALRAEAARSWAAHFGGAAVFTTAERRTALEALKQSGDPLNRERAEAELKKLE